MGEDMQGKGKKKAAIGRLCVWLLISRLSLTRSSTTRLHLLRQ